MPAALPLLRAVAPLTVIAALLACTGCGGSDKPAPPPQEQVRTAWRAAATAAATGDGQGLCKLITAEGKAAIAQRTQLPCPDTVRVLASRLTEADRAAIRTAKITAVTVTGDTATVRYVSSHGLSKVGFTGRTTLTRTGDQWLLSGV